MLIDTRDNEQICNSIFKPARAPSATLGSLGRLPLEVVHEIWHFWISTLCSNSHQVNISVHQISSTMCGYPAAVTHALGAFCAILRTRIASWLKPTSMGFVAVGVRLLLKKPWKIQGSMKMLVHCEKCTYMMSFWNIFDSALRLKIYGGWANKAKIRPGFQASGVFQQKGCCHVFWQMMETRATCLNNNFIQEESNRDGTIQMR